MNLDGRSRIWINLRTAAIVRMEPNASITRPANASIPGTALWQLQMLLIAFRTLVENGFIPIAIPLL